MEAEGQITAPEGVMKVSRIHFTYHLRIPKGRRTDVERVLGVFMRGCPIAQTLDGCVEMIHSHEIIEE